MKKTKHTIGLSLTETQANILMQALECYSRLGMGQLEIAFDAIGSARGKLFDRAVIERYAGTMKAELFGHPLHGSDGICSPKTGTNAKLLTMCWRYCMSSSPSGIIIRLRAFGTDHRFTPAESNR
jgi:hypothetical protein